MGSLCWTYVGFDSVAIKGLDVSRIAPSSGEVGRPIVNLGTGLQSLRVYAEACLVWSRIVPLRLLDRFAADNQILGAAAALNISSSRVS
jgi:hypothetical protein